MSTQQQDTGVQPATDEQIRMRLRQELNALAAVSPGDDHSFTVQLWARGGFHWNCSTHQRSGYCEVSGAKRSAAEAIERLDYTSSDAGQRAKDLRERAAILLKEADALEPQPVTDPNQETLKL